jgi:hypothetical protein
MITFKCIDISLSLYVSICNIFYILLLHTALFFQDDAAKHEI